MGRCSKQIHACKWWEVSHSCVHHICSLSLNLFAWCLACFYVACSSPPHSLFFLSCVLSLSPFLFVVLSQDYQYHEQRSHDLPGVRAVLLLRKWVLASCQEGRRPGVSGFGGACYENFKLLFLQILVGGWVVLRVCVCLILTGSLLADQC